MQALLDPIQLSPTRGTEPLLSDRSFERLRDFIYERTGIYFHDTKRYLLESRISRRVMALGLRSAAEYADALGGSAPPAELARFINDVTVNETYFYRHPPHLEALESTILAQRARARERDRSRRVRFWSAASSTGDEAYTLAIHLEENAKRRFAGLQFEIVGSDLNTEVVDRAREAIFSEYAVKNVPPAILAHHFAPENGRYRLSRAIADRVSFRALNLTDAAATASMRDFDVVYCANVLIYFDVDSKRKVVAALSKSLAPGGYLFLGLSENLFGVSHGLTPVRFANCMAYRKDV